MILSGSEIKRQREIGAITIDPFDESAINPNSYNFRLGDQLTEVISDGIGGFTYKHHRLSTSAEGFLLSPQRMYLGTTDELIGSSQFVMTLLGRSSIGRLGLFLNITADFGHIGSTSRWTLELHVVQKLLVYPHMIIGQVAFWTSFGDVVAYSGRYSGDLLPVVNRDADLER